MFSSSFSFKSFKIGSFPMLIRYRQTNEQKLNGN